MRCPALAVAFCLVAPLGCGDSTPPTPPKVTPPAAIAIDSATQALAKDAKFEGFRQQLREFRKLTAESAALRAKLKAGATDAERARYEALDGEIMQKKSAINEAMNAAGVTEADQKAMRYLFSATDAELGIRSAQ